MMRLPPFRFVAPSTLEEATRLLADAGPTAAIVAGGTDLYPNMKRRQVQPELVVSIAGIGALRSIRQSDNGELVVGGGVTLTQLVDHPLVHEQYTALADAALTISTPLLRNMGTVGGNLCLDTRCHFLNQSAFWRKAVGSCMKAEGDICRVAPGGSRCWAITSGDLPPLLIALGARVRLVGSQGERTIPLADLYRNDGIAYLSKQQDEILAEILIPPMTEKRAGYLKLRRRGTFDFPALGVAAAVQVDDAGRCEDARIVLGAVTSRPLDVSEAEEFVGETFTSETIRRVADDIQRSARPLHLADYTHSYRKRMVSVYVTRLLDQLLSDS